MSPDKSGASATTAPLRAVLFDAAGTLIRLREPVGETYARFAAEHGARIPASRLEEAFGRVLAAAPPLAFPGETLRRAAQLEREAWARIVDGTFRAADGSVRPDDPDALFGALYDHYATDEAWCTVPGAHRALEQLRAAGLQTGVVSNFDQRLRPLLGQLGLHGLLDVITLPADAGAAKPDQRIFDVALKRLGLTAHHSAYVGDHALQDIEAARSVGLRAIDVASLASLEDLPKRLGLEHRSSDV